MKISLYLSILFIALVNKIVTTNAANQPTKIHFCTSRLAVVMNELCRSNDKKKINTNNKRNQMDSAVWDYSDLEDYNAIDYPYQSKQGAITFIQSRFLRSGEKSLINECCINPCYVSELKKYCST